MAREIIPVLTLRGLVVFPGNVVTFDVGRGKSLKALEIAMEQGGRIFLTVQKAPEMEDPAMEDLYKVGTICTIKHRLRLAPDKTRVIVEGKVRGELWELTRFSDYLEGCVNLLDDSTSVFAYEQNELFRRLLDTLDAYARKNKRVTADIKGISEKFAGNLPGLVNEIANALPVDFKIKQDILGTDPVEERAEKVIQCIVHELEIMNLEQEIQQKVQSNMGKMQKDAYLREQMKVIREELGDDSESEAQEYQEKAETLKEFPQVYEKACKEIKRLSRMPFGYPEANVISNYLDVILNFPWKVESAETIDLELAAQILDEDHYGLEKVKERILEYLAVRKITGGAKGPLLCLVGPPGVGKTSIARSIAKALNKKYERMSLGGVRDEAELRGHRKTYVGAMPGRIVNAIAQAGTKNPLILLDEVDKMGSDYRGDPTAALLEILDPEQNCNFRDHFMELPVDLSSVLFLCTANGLEGIPGPLRDRMEIIEVSSYTQEEKLQIALRHLFPKQLSVHGLSSKKVTIREDAMQQVIACYTAEAGVRGLEREIAKMCRRIARLFAEGKRKSYTVTLANVEKLLGTPKRLPEQGREEHEVGVCTGLAWTSIGGVTLNIEVNVMPGTGKLELTGHLGDVMKESAVAAMSFIRSRVHQLGLEPDFHSKNDIHIHIPEGATPKDGPSAGITLATALVSALTGLPCDKNVAMTGEITLRGRVLPIGGLKEKSLAAYRAGIRTIVIPEDNKKDLEEIPAEIRSQIRFVPAKNMDLVLQTALIGFKQTFFCGIMHNNTAKGACVYEHI